MCVCECGQGLTTQAHKDVHTSNTLNTLDTITSFFKILHLIYVLITVPDTVPDIVHSIILKYTPVSVSVQ